MDSILDWAHNAGKSVGFVTTTRITHASPAALYAHTHERDMEAYDGKILTEQLYKDGCRDIASQLIDDNQFINVKIEEILIELLINLWLGYFWRW